MTRPRKFICKNPVHRKRGWCWRGSRWVAVFAVSLLLSGCTALKTKKFWIETAVVAAAATADGITTDRLLKRCPTCEEQVGTALLGRRPSTARIFWTGFLFHGTKRGIIAGIWHYDKELGTRLSTADAVVFGFGHAAFAYSNTKVCDKGYEPARGGCRGD